MSMQGQRHMPTELFEKNLHLPDLQIRGFRGITNLSVPRFGRVTLITGMNNTGKTSILEAIRLLADGAAPEVIREILQLRGENSRALSTSVGRSFLVSALFHGFPQLSEGSSPIYISSHDGARRIQMEVDWFVESRDEGGGVRFVPYDSVLIDEGFDSAPALVVKTGNRTRMHPIDRIDRLATTRNSRPRSDSNQTVCRFINASGSEQTESIGELWDDITINGREGYVVDALKIIDDTISAVFMVGEAAYRQTRTAVVSSDKFERRVPLRSFGEGMNRLFGIVVSLINAEDGILLIDEFENSMHYSVLVDVWRMIFRLAEKMNVQVLATTHSFDCVAGFRQAAAELDQSEGFLVRIDRRGNQMRVVEYTEEDLQVAIAQRIEFR